MATEAQTAADDLEAMDAEGPDWLAVHHKSLRQHPIMGALPGNLSHPAHLGRDDGLPLPSHPQNVAQKGMQALGSLTHQLAESGD